MMSHNDGLIAVPLAYIFPAIAELCLDVVDLEIWFAQPRVISHLITRLVMRPSYGRFVHASQIFFLRMIFVAFI